MPKLILSSNDDILNFVSIRAGEKKIGEFINVSTLDELDKQSAQFVILGCPEDVGVKKNFGLGGTNSTWNIFLSSFLNIQENCFFHGGDILLLGAIEVDESDTVETIDEIVVETISSIIKAGKIPILIGGGHNNSYGMIKGASKALNRKINVINLDPHADFRVMEGRHSGNGFSFAYHDGFLDKYAVLGLHKGYNNKHIIGRFNALPNLKSFWFEDIFISEKMSYNEALSKLLSFVNHEPFGVELDLDAIENTLSSAMTPVGITPREAMKYIFKCGQVENAVYLHLPEGIFQREDGLEQKTIGKLISYLVQSFIQGKKQSIH